MGKLPTKIELTANGLSVVDSELPGVIIATANTPEIAKAIVDRWNAASAKPVSLKKLNKAIQKEFPTCFLFKGEGYYFIASDDEVWGEKIAMMHQQSIHVHKLSHQSMERWIEDVRKLFLEPNLKENGNG